MSILALKLTLESFSTCIICIYVFMLIARYSRVEVIGVHTHPLALSLAGPILSSSLAMASLLWAAVPAVTLAGERAVSRGSASILMSGAAASSWLVANTAQEYEDLAVALARRPAAVASLRDQLRQQRTGPGVFDTRAWNKELETALFLCWDTVLATGESHRHLRSS